VTGWPDWQRAGRELAVASGLPAAAVTGFQFAFDSGADRGRRAVPAHSALSAAVLAVIIVMTTLTFGGTVSFTLAGPGLRLQDPLTIVGTATMPTVGQSNVLHTSMGTGALASAQLLGPAAASCAGPPGIGFTRRQLAATVAWRCARSEAPSTARLTAGQAATLSGLPRRTPGPGDRNGGRPGRAASR
jgi:hypothetical protein